MQDILVVCVEGGKGLLRVIDLHHWFQARSKEMRQLSKRISTYRIVHCNPLHIAATGSSTKS